MNALALAKTRDVRPTEPLGLGSLFASGRQGVLWNLDVPDESAVADLLGASPQLALARALRWPMQPYEMTVEVDNFLVTNGRSATVGVGVTGLQFANGDSVLSQDALIDSVVVRVEDQSAGQVIPGGTGTTIPTTQPLVDFGLALMGNVLAVCGVIGAGPGPGTQDYWVAPFLTQLSALFDFAGGDWPRGWVLRDGQTVRMGYLFDLAANNNFASSTPPFQGPMNIATVFRMTQPMGGRFRHMTEPTALGELDNLGFDTSWYRRSRGVW